MKNQKTQEKRDNLPSPPSAPSTPVNWKLKDITEKQLQEAKILLTQDHVTVHRTDWLFISNCEPIAEMKRLRSGQMRRGRGGGGGCWEMLNPSAQQSHQRAPLAEIQRQTREWRPRERWSLGWSPKWKASDEGSRGKLMVRKRKMTQWKGSSEEILCTEVVWIRKEKGDNTLPAGEWRFS